MRTGVARASAFPLTDDAGACISGSELVENPEHRFVKTDVDHLAGSACAYMQQCDQHADGSVQAGEIVAERRRAGRHRRAIRHAGKCGQTANGVGDAREAGPVPVGPGLPVSGDAQQDQLGVDAREFVPAEAPAFQCSGPEVLANDIRVVDQPPEQARSLARPQISALSTSCCGLRRARRASNPRARSRCQSGGTDLPLAGSSTLMTSAPNSERMVAQ